MRLLDTPSPTNGLYMCLIRYPCSWVISRLEYSPSLMIHAVTQAAVSIFLLYHPTRYLPPTKGLRLDGTYEEQTGGGWFGWCCCCCGGGQRRARLVTVESIIDAEADFLCTETQNPRLPLPHRIPLRWIQCNEKCQLDKIYHGVDICRVPRNEKFSWQSFTFWLLWAFPNSVTSIDNLNLTPFIYLPHSYPTKVTRASELEESLLLLQHCTLENFLFASKKEDTIGLIDLFHHDLTLIVPSEEGHALWLTRFNSPRR